MRDLQEEGISDDLIDRLKNVNSEDLRDYLKNDGVEPKCPVCSSKFLMVPFETNTTDATPRSYMVPSMTPYLFREKKIGVTFSGIDYLSYKVICSRCAHEIYFNASRVLDWVEARNKKI